MTEFLPFYGTAVTVVGFLVTLYAIDIFLKERKRWAELRRTMVCFVLAALCFTVAGLFLGFNYMDVGERVILRSAPQLFYLLGFIFLLIGGRKFKKFSDALHSERKKINKDEDKI